MTGTPDRILASHAGTLPRPDGLKEQLAADPNSADSQKRLTAAVADVVRKQADIAELSCKAKLGDDICIGGNERGCI